LQSFTFDGLSNCFDHDLPIDSSVVYGTSLPKTPAILDLVWLIILSVGFT